MCQRERKGPKARTVTGYKGGNGILDRNTSNVKLKLMDFTIIGF